MSRRSGTPTHMLKVGVVSSKYLKQTNSWNVGSDAYVDVRVSCSPAEKKSTSVVKQSTTPEWGETFDFVLSDNPADDILLVQVNGQKSLSSPAFIGRVEIPITLLLHQMPVDGWYRLLPQYSFPGVASKTPPRIRLRLHYYYLAANGLPQMPQFVNGNNPNSNVQSVPGQFNRAAFPPTVMARAPGVPGTVTMPGTVTGGLPITMTRNGTGSNSSSAAALIQQNQGNGSHGGSSNRATFPCPFCQKKFTESEINQHAERCIETSSANSRDIVQNNSSSSRQNQNQNRDQNNRDHSGFSSSLSESPEDDDGLTSSLQRLSTSSPSSRSRSNTTPSSSSSNSSNSSSHQNSNTGTSLSSFVNNNSSNSNNRVSPGAYPSLRDFDNNTNNINTNINTSHNNNNNMSSSHSNNTGNSMAARMEMLSSMEQSLPASANPSSSSSSSSFPSFPSIPNSGMYNTNSMNMNTMNNNINTMNMAMNNGGNIPVVYPYYEPHQQLPLSNTNNTMYNHSNANSNGNSMSFGDGGMNMSMNGTGMGGMGTGMGMGMDLPPQYNVAVGYNQGMYNPGSQSGVNGGSGVAGGNNNNNNSGNAAYTLDSLLDN